MKIALICEPRSGSTNLAYYFLQNKNFTVLFEPITNKNLANYKGEIHPKNWRYNTEHLLVKEVHNMIQDFSELIEISDKIVILYREDEKSQLESWYNAKKTNNWGGKWAFRGNDNMVSEIDIEHFRLIKSSFEKKYIKNDNFFKISYEDLYLKNKFINLKNYIGLDELDINMFPFGEKYRIDIKNNKII